MVQVVAGEIALKGRRIIKSRGTGEEHWRTDFLGRQGDGGAIKEEPQAFLIEMHANESILPHFHEVDQFQVFVAGSGGMGRQPAATLAVQHGIGMPTMMASLSYYDSYRRERLPANLTQAQRDFFGAHTFLRTDRDGSFHAEWNS